MRILTSIAALLAGQVAAQVPRSEEAPQLVLPNYAKEVPAFRQERRHALSWRRYVVNAGFGGGRAQECRGGFLDQHWQLVDCLGSSRRD